MFLFSHHNSLSVFLRGTRKELEPAQVQAQLFEGMPFKLVLKLKEQFQ